MDEFHYTEVIQVTCRTWHPSNVLSFLNIAIASGVGLAAAAILLRLI